MKNKIENFKTYNARTNENLLALAGGMLTPAIGLLLYYGVMYGYVKLGNLFNFISFTRAASKLSPIFDKIKDDAVMKKLILKLGEYKDGLYFGEEEGENPRRTKAFQIRDGIYQRAKELLDGKEYNIFINAAKEFERGAERPAGYFTNKDAKFQGWKYTV